MKISRRLYLGFTFVILLAMVIGMIGIVGMDRLRIDSEFMYEKHVLSLEYIERAVTSFKQMRLDCRQAVICSFYDDAQGANVAKQSFYSHADTYSYWLSECKRISASDELTRFFDKIIELSEQKYIPASISIIDESIKEIPDHAHKFYLSAMFARLSKLGEEMEVLFNGSMDLTVALAKQTNLNNALMTSRLTNILVFLLIAAIILAATVALYVTDSISRPIAESADVLGRIAGGDFDARVAGEYKDEFGLIKSAVNDTAFKLGEYFNGKLAAEHDAYLSKIDKERADAAREAVLSGITYASRIQRNLIRTEAVFAEAFCDYSIIWDPRDIVSGDIYWIKRFSGGTVLAVCDCTGHGTPGALLTMLVVSGFESFVREKNCSDTAWIVWRLDQWLANAMKADGVEEDKLNSIKDGCDLAVLYIADDGSVDISSSNIHVFICDGKTVKQVTGRKLRVGEGLISCKEKINVAKIEPNPDNKFYIASDGLYDQIGDVFERPFGYGAVKKIILAHHNESQSTISHKIRSEFELHRGQQQRRDDVELITFKPHTKPVSTLF